MERFAPGTVDLDDGTVRCLIELQPEDRVPIHQVIFQLEDHPMNEVGLLIDPDDQVVDFAAEESSTRTADILIEETLKDPGAVEIGYADGQKIGVVIGDDALEVSGVNSIDDLKFVEQAFGSK